MVSLEDLDSKWEIPIDPICSIPISFPTTHNQVGDAYMNIGGCHLAQVVGVTGSGCFRRSHLSAVTFRLTNQAIPIMRAPTIQLFESGKVVIMGASSVSAIIYHLHKARLFFYARGWRSPSGQKPISSRIFITNWVSSGAHNKPLSIDQFERKDKLNTVVHRASFSGIGRRTLLEGCRNPLTFGLFKTGKYNVTGYNSSIHSHLVWQMQDIFQRNEDIVTSIDYRSRLVNNLRREVHYHGSIPKLPRQFIIHCFDNERKRIAEELATIRKT